MVKEVSLCAGASQRQVLEQLVRLGRVGDVHDQRRERCEVVARQRAVGSPAALKMGGRRPARERDRVLSRIAEKPDLTLRALLKELAERGLAVSYYALWHFLQHEGLTFKKKPSRLRTGPVGRRQAA